MRVRASTPLSSFVVVIVMAKKPPWFGTREMEYSFSVFSVPLDDEKLAAGTVFVRLGAAVLGSSPGPVTDDARRRLRKRRQDAETTPQLQKAA
jgi:hypothetical protein